MPHIKLGDVKPLSSCPSGNLHNSRGTTDTYPTKNITPIELDKELIKKIVRNTKHYKTKSRPILHYKPLFSWEAQSANNNSSNRNSSGLLTKNKQMFQPQSSFRFKGARSSLPAVGSKTPRSVTNQILQQSDNIETNESGKDRERVSKPDSRESSVQLPFTDNHSLQTNFELLAANTNKSLPKQEITRGTKSQFFDFKARKKSAEKDIIHARIQTRVFTETTPLVSRSIIHHSNTDRQGRSSLLKKGNYIAAIARQKCTVEDSSELPKIKRMNAFVDKEETKTNETTAVNGENDKVTESIAFVLRKEYKKKEEEKRRKNVMKSGDKITSNAEKKRLWIGGNGKFDSVRLKFWYDKMKDFL
jgi:hypothetical protein